MNSELGTRNAERGTENPDLGGEFPGYTNVFEGQGVAEGEGFDRRRFLELMAASMALAGGVTGCRRPDIEILPYSKSPENVVPGLPTYYATSIPRPGGAVGVVVESHEGRPTKVEGNPEHPSSEGRTDLFAQASVLELYAPDRARAVLAREKAGDPFQVSSWADFEAAAAAAFADLKKKKGQGLRFLAEDVPSPMMRRVRAHAASAYPQSAWHVYEPAGDDNARRGAEVAFGAPFEVTYRIDKADVVLALDSDFLGADFQQVRHARGWAKKRRVTGPGAEMNRLYVVENLYTTTGGNADHRLRVPAAHVGDFLLALAQKLVTAQPGGRVSELVAAAKPRVAGNPETWARWVDAVAADLRDKAGRGLILVGRRQPAAVHALAHLLNQTLGNNGVAVEFRRPPEGPPAKSLADLARELEAGKVTALVVLGGNPAFTAPADYRLGELIAKVPFSARLGLFVDETSERCLWHLPTAHDLEAWGDAEAADGTYSPVQPLIAPLYGGRSAAEVVAGLTGMKATDGFTLTKESFAAVAGTADPKALRRWLHTGVLPGSARKPETPALAADAVAKELEGYRPDTLAAVGETNVELSFHLDARIYDGRYAANPWLQETPDPVTKLTWDNAALVSPLTARTLLKPAGGGEVKTGDMLRITVGSATVALPAFVLPGQADHSVSVWLGFGRLDRRLSANLRGVDSGGFDVYPLRLSSAPFFTTAGVRVERDPRRYTLAATQTPGTLDETVRTKMVRQFTREGLKEHAKHAHAGHDHSKHPHGKAGPRVNFAGHQEPEGHDHGRGEKKLIPLHVQGDLAKVPDFDALNQWGMVIDLTACVGCSACVVACQAENNVPVVGKDEVARHREMHWIRIDRYFAGGTDDPQVVYQPLACVHCERAPCETVCPVNAAVHSPEGLNLQVYNRCVGTRYCSNNCPYKVRRFNWFDYNQRPLDQLRLGPLTEKGTPETLKMQKNPDVTVRMRGVMEKCTYCVQRIERGSIGHRIAQTRAGKTKPEDFLVPDGLITPACAQACPTDAIVFGNLRDPHSRVSRLKSPDVPHNYLPLDEDLNVRPRTSYLARVRNPNPALEPKAAAEGHA